MNKCEIAEPFLSRHPSLVNSLGYNKHENPENAKRGKLESKSHTW